jgi:starvation-inducible outer membrane lipoprotein
MKTLLRKYLWLLLLAILSPGCVSIPPLIQVQHKDGNNSDLVRRLDSIDRRLDQLEKKAEAK